MSKAIVREKFKDFFKGRLPFEEVIEIQEAYKAIYGLMIEYDSLAPVYLVRYSTGYSIEELADMFGSSTESVIKALHHTYVLFGEVLQLDDSMIIRRIQKPLQTAAKSVLYKIYIEFGEIE
jgi:hypothetical protein